MILPVIQTSVRLERLSVNDRRDQGPAIVCRRPRIGARGIIAEPDRREAASVRILPVAADRQVAAPDHPHRRIERPFGLETVFERRRRPLSSLQPRRVVVGVDDVVTDDLADVAVVEAVVARQQHGTGRERDRMVEEMRTDRHVKINVDTIALLPGAAQVEIRAGNRTLGNGLAVWRLQRIANMLHICQARAEDNMAVTGLRLICPDSGQTTAEPRQATAEHRVVVGMTTIPIFPRGSGSLLYPPAVTGEILLVQNRAGHICQTDVAQDLEEELGTHESHVDVSLAILHDFLSQGVYDLLTTGFRNTHAQSKDIAAGNTVTLLVLVIETTMEIVGHFVGHCLIACCQHIHR